MHSAGAGAFTSVPSVAAFPTYLGVAVPAVEVHLSLRGGLALARTGFGSPGLAGIDKSHQRTIK